MKKITTTLMLVFLMLASNISIEAQISGTVFRDFNANGVKNNSATFNEPFVAGVTVKAFTSSNTQIGATKTTDAAGAYSFSAAEIPNGTKVRIEFSGLLLGDVNSFNGTANGTNVQFATAPSTTTNFAVNNPAEYSNSSNPKLAVSQFVNNNSAAANTSRTIFDINYDGTGTATNLATRATTGSTWGLAYDKKSKRLFTSALLKRHAQLGPLGLGGIYEINYTNPAAPVVTNWANIDTMAGVDVGTTARPGGVDYTIDALAFGEIGKIGLGGLDLSDNGDTMYVMNLNNNGQLVVINRNTKALIATYAIPNPGCGVATDVRPFGLKYFRGAVYIGVICSGQTTTTNQNFTVYKFINGTFTSVLSDDLIYPKGWVHATYAAPPTLSSSWETWSDNFSDINVLGSSALGPRWSRPQAILSDIEFDIEGTMILGFADRGGLQLGYASRDVANTTNGNGYVGGEILRTTKTGSTYTLEINGIAGGVTGGGPGNNKGPGNGEFYTGETFTTGGVLTHEETSNGGLALLVGSGEVVLSAMDPSGTVFTGGFIKLSNTTGLFTSGYQSYATTAGANSTFGKAAGIGDIEILADFQPIQIGNRIWLDTNGDGIQGSDETTAGVPTGTTVTLRSPGVDGIYGNGDDQTWTTTTDANGNYYFSTLATADNRKPASWTGVGNTLLPGFDYRVEVAIPVGSNVTKTDVITNGLDNIDNDATTLATNAVVAFNTGNTNHNFDIGFKTLASLGNKVWLDEGAGGGTRNNGVQDGTEPGVAGVAVNLYTNGADGLPGTNDDVLVGSTLTDAFGMYLFENLQPSTGATTQYNVRVTPPANYSITTQTNTTDDNNTTGASTTGSDVNALGISYSIDLSAGENNPNIDAGLVFNTATPPNSIGDKVWLDANGNGTNDGGAAEPGVAGVTVTLYNAAGDVVAVTTTDAQGMYLFNNLPANTNFTVGFSAPAGTRLTSGGVLSIGNTTTNSDASPTTGITTTINTGVAGTQITGVDAGLILDPKGAIGDYVWNDLDRDGIQDVGEQGVAGVTMRLYSPGPDGVIGGGDDVLLATTTTDSKGYYVFPNLDPEKYFVVATPVTGYTRTLENVTAANPGGDTKDSDFLSGTGTYAASYVSPLYTLLLTAGGVTRDMTVDLGIHSNVTINTLNTLGDKVWNDVDKDGIQDAGEAGVANVTVRLLNNAGVPVNNPATGKPYVVTTDANGNYKFVDLPDGNYIVEFANLPAGYSFTGQDKDAANAGLPGSATDGSTDSDAKTTTGRTGVISVDALSASATSVNIINVDAGISQGIEAGLASLGNRVWYDLNNNGLQDAGELGVNNVKVELLDAAGNPVNAPGTALPYVLRTNALGEYMFTGLPAGDYTVRFSQLPAGFTSSASNVGANANDETDADANYAGTSVTATTTAITAVYTLQTGEENVTVDMGIVPAAGTNSLGNFVWFDSDADGIQDAGEIGTQGVMVKLYTNGADGLPGTADDVVVGTTVTDKNGAYSFVGLPDGNYNVGFENLPMGFNFTEPNAAGSTAANGSDASRANGRTGTIALDPTGASATGINNPDVDAGIVTTRAALGNYVWYDADSDGVQDAGEKPVVGATVILYASNGTTVLASTMTDATGFYFFPNLPAGDYVVGFSTIPTNTEFTQQNTPGDNGNNTNSDANPTTGLSSVITLVAGEVDPTVDAGIKPTLTASVGDKVWLDKNGDGLQGADEPGVPGVLVTLKDNLGNVVGTAVTDGNGNYRIDGIKPGTGFTITFSSLPAGATFTTQTSDVSTTDATLGSDANPSGVTASFDLLAGQYLPHVDAGLINIQLLPIKIISFTAVPKGSQVNLEWIVSEQTGVDKYEVEASADSRTFTTIATIASNGNQGATYDAVHTSPVAGINFYRIKTIEKDGKISYSQIRKVNFSKGGDVVIYPNPVSTGVVNITLTGNMINKAATVSIISMEGKLISQQQLVKTSQTETIDVSRFANGSYIVRLITKDEVVNKTIHINR